MARRRYLVTYDVASDHRRTRIFRILQDHGDHLQFSVFLCELNDRELVGLRGALHLVIHHREDQILVVDLGAADREPTVNISSMGRGFVVPSRVIVV